jgi:hypothetical protein
MTTFPMNEKKDSEASAYFQRSALVVIPFDERMESGIDRHRVPVLH